MNDDLLTFWQNTVCTHDLFYDLLDRAACGAYDDDFLALLAAYRDSNGTPAHADIFAAEYLLANNDAENAIICGERAYRRRPVNAAVWRVLAAAHHAQGNAMDTAIYRAYLHRLAGDLPPDAPPGLDSPACMRLTRAMNGCLDAPLVKKRAAIENNVLTFHPDIFIGEYLPVTVPVGSAPFWVASYADRGFLSDRSELLADARSKSWFHDEFCRDFPFDLQKAEEVRGTVHIDMPTGREALLPLAGTTRAQELIVSTPADDDRIAYLGKWSYSYVRLSAPTTLTCEDNAPFAVGTPILLGHSPTRKKLVLNLLIDALPWNVVRNHFSEWMPNIARFFARGTIFDAHFSTSEHTYPALPAIETGRYPHHTQLFHAGASHELSPTVQTLAECMKDLGYHTIAPILTTDSIYNSTMRGYDRLITTTWNQPASIGADRMIHLIDALGEADLFTFLHLSDVHPWDAMGFRFAPEVETRLPLRHRLFAWEKATASVRLPDFEIYKAQFRAGLADVDRSIGLLLSHIEHHYAEEEYIVSLYSDHGSSIFTPRTDDVALDIIGENSTAAAWMMRGAGVPEGLVADELTSSVDIYPTLAHLAGFAVAVAPDIDGNLPAVFGGKERDVVYSSSQYPGQTFKLAVRTHDYALRLETCSATEEDGTADFADARVGIYPRAHECEKAYALDSDDLRRFFYPRARAFVQEIANNGERFPL